MVAAAASRVAMRDSKLASTEHMSGKGYTHGSYSAGDGGFRSCGCSSVGRASASQAECRRFEPVHPLFTSAIRLPSVLTPLWMPASPSRRHPPGSQAEVRGRWVSSTREVRRKFVAGGCPRLGKSGGSSWPVGVLDLPRAEVRGRWVSSTREVRRKSVAGGCPRLGKSGGSSWPVGVLDLPTPFEWPIHQVGRCVSRIPPEFRIPRGKASIPTSMPPILERLELTKKRWLELFRLGWGNLRGTVIGTPESRRGEAERRRGRWVIDPLAS